MEKISFSLTLFSDFFMGNPSLRLSEVLYCIKYPFISILAHSILDMGKEVLWQTMKTPIKPSSWTEIHDFIDFLTGNPLNYKMDSPILVVSIYIYWIIPGMKRVNTVKPL